jgi:hypothetical protein
LPQFETPKPKQKMKTFNWNKLPVNKVWGKNNIWSLVAKKNEKPTTKSPNMDFGDMENLFCQQVAPPPQAAQSSSGSKEASATDGKKNEVKHVSSLLVLILLFLIITNL